MEEKFMTATEWENAEKFTGREILKWAELPEEVIFQVICIETKVNPNFTSHVIHFADKKNETYKCWGPQHFVEQICRNRSTSQRPYFVSQGLVTSGAKQVANFEISYQDAGKEFLQQKGLILHRWLYGANY